MGYIGNLSCFSVVKAEAWNLGFLLSKISLVLCSEVSTVWAAGGLQRGWKLSTHIQLRTALQSSCTSHLSYGWLHCPSSGPGSSPGLPICCCKTLYTTAIKESTTRHYSLILSEDEKLSICVKDFRAIQCCTPHFGPSAKLLPDVTSHQSIGYFFTQKKKTTECF